jgi:hypothetical protein
MRLMLFSAHHWRATVGEQFNTAIGVLLSGANGKAFSHGIAPLDVEIGEAALLALSR